MPISQMRKLSIEKGKATCSTSQLKSHTGSPGPQPEVPSMAPLPCMGSAVSMRFGALGMGGAELIGVNGIDVSGLETVQSMHRAVPPARLPALPSWASLHSVSLLFQEYHTLGTVHRVASCDRLFPLARLLCEPSEWLCVSGLGSFSLP